MGAGVLALIPAHVERVSVGKRSGRHSKDQDAINALLVEAALAGKRVVRLKGGDPSMFGRSAEEIACLARHGVTVRDVLLTAAGAIPRTSSGKIGRRACRSAYLDGSLRTGKIANAFPDESA